MKKRFLFVFGICFLIGFQMWVLHLVTHAPYIGLRTKENVVSNVNEPSTAVASGVQMGDIVTRVNGEIPGMHWSITRFGSLEQAKTMSVLRSGQEIIFSFSSVPTINNYDIFMFLIQVISMGMAGILWWKVKRTPTSGNLAYTLIAVAGIFMSMPASIRADPLGKMMLSVSMFYTFIYFLQFVITFLQEKVNMVFVPFPRYIHMVLLIFVAIELIYFIDSPLTQPVYELANYAMLLAGFCAVGTSLGLLVYAYWKHRRTNLQFALIVRTVSWALIFSVVPVTFLTFLPLAVFGDSWMPPVYSSWFVFILPLTFLYLLATRRLYDVDVIVRRMLITITIALVPTLLLGGMAKAFFFRNYDTDRLLFFFILFWISNSVMLYTLEYLTSKLEPFLFPRKHRLAAALKTIAHNLGTVSTTQGLKDIFLTDIMETLELDGAAIVIANEDGLDTVEVGHLEDRLIKEALYAANKEITMYTCFEIARQEQGTRYLIVSGKKSGAMLGMEDLNWLRLVLSYLSVALENVQLIRKLDDKVQHLSGLIPTEEEADNLLWFQKLMLNYQEQERVRLAMDLHDTTMQDLFFLKRSLQLTPDMAPSEMEKHIGKLSDYIDRINRNLRQSCFELHPHLLKELGLVGTLQRLLQVERKLNDFQIHFISFGDKEIEEQEMELKRNVFRMVQELLNNAKKYADAANVRFSLGLEEDVMYLEYMDDGVGFDPAKPVVREIGSNGMGIRQMKTRIMAMGGSCELRSEPGKGVHFEAELPARNRRKG